MKLSSTVVLLLLMLLLGLPLRGTGQAPTPASAPAPASVNSVIYAVAPTASGPMELVMDLYRPAEGSVKGAVVLAHGGAFTGGSRTLQENADYGQALASRGYLTAAISYRLAGDEPVLEVGWADAYARMVLAHDVPRMVGAVEQIGEGFATAVAAAAVDQAAAVAWLRERAGELGFEAEDVALFGASAGAITALTLAYAMDLYGAEDVEVAAVVDLRGLLLRPEGAPVPFDGGGPPLLILHGEDDQRVPLADAEEVFRLAREGGTPVELHVAPGVGHELGGRRPAGSPPGPRADGAGSARRLHGRRLRRHARPGHQPAHPPLAGPVGKDGSPGHGSGHPTRPRSGAGVPRGAGSGRAGAHGRGGGGVVLCRLALRARQADTGGLRVRCLGADGLVVLAPGPGRPPPRPHDGGWP